MILKTTSRFLLFTFALILNSIIAFAADENNISQSMKISRTHTRYSGELVDGSLQEIALKVGAGSYWVRAAVISNGEEIATAPRVLYFYSSLVDLKTRQPRKRVFVGNNNGRISIVAGDDVELLDAYLKSTPLVYSDDVTLRLRLGAAISATLYENRAKLLRSEWRNFSDSALDAVRYGGEKLRHDLRELAIDCRLTKNMVRNCVIWTGRFLLNDGSVDEIALEITEMQRVVALGRTNLRRVGFFPSVSVSGSSAEEWTIQK